MTYPKYTSCEGTESDSDTAMDSDTDMDGESLSATSTTDPQYTTVVVAKRPSPVGEGARISQEEIGLRGGRNLPETLAVEPSVEVNRSPKTGATLEIRGFDEKSVQLLYEGIPIREVYDGHFDIAALPVFSFETVDLQKGIASPLFGTNSAGGIVQMNAPAACGSIVDTRLFGSPSDKESRTFGGQAKACAKISNLTLFAGAGYERSEGDALSHAYEENQYNASYHESGGVRDGSDYERASLGFLAKYAPERNKHLTLVVNAIHSPRSIPPFEGYGYLRYWRFVKYNTLLVGVSGTYGPETPPVTFGFRNISAHLYTHIHRDEIRDYEDTTYTRLTSNSLAWFVASAYANETYGASIESAFTLFKGNTLDVALRYNWDRHRQREIPVPEEGEASLWTPFEKYGAHTFTAAVEETQAIGNWRLNAGFGASGMSLLTEEIRNISYTVDKRIIPAFEGRLVTEYSPFERLRWMVAVGHKVRYPMLKELFSNTIGGNPDLDSEHAWMAEAGVVSDGFPIDGLDVSVHFFGNFVRDLIDNYRDVYANIGRSVLAGSEVALRYTPIDLLQFYSGYRYLFARDLEHERVLDYRTPHRVVLGERLFFGFGLTFAVEAVFNSGQKAYYVDTVSGDWIEDSLSAFILLNGHLRYERTVRDRSTIYLYLDGFNLLDINYCVGSFEPRSGREVIIGIGSRI